MCYFKSYLPGEISKHFLKCKGYCFNSSQCYVAAKFLRWNCPLWPHDKVALGFFPPWNVKNLNCYLKKKDPEDLACTYHNDSSLVGSSLDFGWVQLYEKCNVLLIGSSIFLLILIKLLTKLFLFLLLILYSFVNKKFREIDLFDFTSFFCITVSLYSSCFCSHLSY